jgi:hypothetical protein
MYNNCLNCNFLMVTHFSYNHQHFIRMYEDFFHVYIWQGWIC